MKVSITLELEAESVPVAVSQVLYALDCEGGDVEVLEVNASPAYTADSTVESTTTVHNNITYCAHPEEIALEGQVEIAKARALPATLS